MRLASQRAAILISLACIWTGNSRAAEDRLDQVNAMLRRGATTVRIVAFGDSITGVYYHTGGRRAWCDMLGIALGKIYPQAKIEMINAGVSGHTTTQGLARIERDVIAHQPHLVVAMFGMNDATGADLELFRVNTESIVRRCRESGAAVVLSTPNSVYPNERRPLDRLARFTQTTRRVADQLSVPLADAFAVYEGLRESDPIEWKLLMSETIHPSMSGHRLFAETMAETISGQRVSLADVGPYCDPLHFTIKRLVAGRPLNVIAMEPYDRIVPDVLGKLFPGARIKTTSWPVQGQSLSSLEAWSKRIRGQKPHLVVIAVPADATAQDQEAFIRSYNWILNWSISFGQSKWDMIGILPSVTGPVARQQQPREELARRIILGIDTACVQRPANDSRPAAAVLLDWLTRQTE